MRKMILGAVAALLCTAAGAQKGEKSVSAGGLISFPSNSGDPVVEFKTGWGAEVNGVLMLTNRSGLQVQAGIGGFQPKYFPDHWTFYWTKAGYRYQFGTSGFYLNGLLGPEFDLEIGDPFITFTGGGGKRFFFAGKHFIEVGVEYVFGDTENRTNLKLAYGLRWKATTARPQ
jgi:hypothetical protein